MAFTFSQKVKTISKLISKPKVLSALISQRDFGYLYEVGWFESFLANKSIDSNSKPIPWLTYPFIDFLTPRLNKRLTLFEFGSGNSTLFFADKVKVTISIEHNKEWYQIVNKLKPENVKLILTESDSENHYLKYLNNPEESADIILVDGLYRNECTIQAVKNLSESGVVILDDSEREEYKPGKDFILGKGFKSLEFWGIAPTILFKKCTTVFYQSNNCLEI